MLLLARVSSESEKNVQGSEKEQQNQPKEHNNESTNTPPVVAGMWVGLGWVPFKFSSGLCCFGLVRFVQFLSLQ